MAHRKKRKSSARDAAARRQSLRDALPPGTTLDEMGDLCRAVHPKEFRFGCTTETHSLALAIEIIDNSELFCVKEQILEWLRSVGGACDCTTHSKALRWVLRLSKDLWE